MRRRTTLAGALLLALALDAGVAGCVQLPHSGPVKSVTVQDDADSETLVDYTPAGPKKGTPPIPLVDNFLTSMTATPLNTRVAREFLTSSSSDRWVPERGTVVYGNQQIVSKGRGNVLLRLRDVVELGGGGAWRGDPTGGRGHNYDLRLVKQGGQWRIDKPPDRLLIPRAHFDTQYEQFLLYFVAKAARVLVPEPVYVPRGRQAPTLLVASLLRGPRPGPGVERTLLPRGTHLDGISVPVSRDGTAEVPLSDQILEIDDNQLSHGLRPAGVDARPGDRGTPGAGDRRRRAGGPARCTRGRHGRRLVGVRPRRLLGFHVVVRAALRTSRRGRHRAARRT